MIHRYRIPIMSVCGTLIELQNTKKYKELQNFCTKNIEPECFFCLEAILGANWYVEVVTDDRWLAWKLVQKY